MADVMRGYVERGELAGVVTLLCRHDEVQVEAIGAQNLATATPIQRETIFRIASMTKPITAAAAMILVEETKLRLDEPVDRWLPELADRKVLRGIDSPLDDTVPAKRPITLRDLLTFRLGVGAVMAFVSIHIVDQGGDLGTVGLVWGVGAAVEIPIMLAFPLLARRFGAERLLLLGAVAFALRAAGWALASGPILDVLVAPLGGMGFALFYVGLVGLIARSVPAEAQATAQGLFAGMTFSLGSVVGSVVAGVVAPIVGLPSLFMVAGGATLLGALVVGRGIAGSRLARV